MIREATLEDVPAIIEMGQRFFDASGYDGMTSYDPVSASTTYINLIQSPDGILLVHDGENGPDGMTGALLFPFFFNNSHKHGQEVFWWVNPESRGSGVQLFRALENIARERGAKSLAMATVASLESEAVGRIYERFGYSLSDLTYVKAL